MKTKGTKKLYIAVHTYKYGSEVYAIMSDHEPKEKEFIKAWNINFEPEREEYIELFGPEEIKEI